MCPYARHGKGRRAADGSGVHAGTCYLPVQFTAMSDGYQVARQEAVSMAPGRIGVVTLDEENPILPKNRRQRSGAGTTASPDALFLCRLIMA